MRAVVQRVKKASVHVEGHGTTGSIDCGMVVLLGISSTDTIQDLEYLADKVCKLRIFPDQDGKLNRSVNEAQGSILVVSQFTLQGDCRKGNRPGFDKAAQPEQAEPLYIGFVERCRSVHGLAVSTGIFRADMELSLINDGPVTLLLDSEKKF